VRYPLAPGDDGIATQRIILANLGGAAAAAVAVRFRRWLGSCQGGNFPAPVRREVDQFAVTLRANAASPPIIYYCEWVDMWSMGDVIPALGVPGARVVRGDRYDACCHDSNVSLLAPTLGGEMAQEAEWLVARLREARSAWSGLVSESALVVLREALGGTVTDEELQAALWSVPRWLGDGIS
jgi:hypothetical protein